MSMASGTHLGTMLAPDATVEIHIAPGLETRVLLTQHLENTVDRTDLKTGLTTRATVSVNHRQNARDTFEVCLQVTLQPWARVHVDWRRRRPLTETPSPDQTD